MILKSEKGIYNYIGAKLYLSISYVLNVQFLSVTINKQTKNDNPSYNHNTFGRSL